MAHSEKANELANASSCCSPRLHTTTPENNLELLPNKLICGLAAIELLRVLLCLVVVVGVTMVKRHSGGTYTTTTIVKLSLVW